MAPTQVLSFGFIDVNKNIGKKMSWNNYCISKKKKKKKKKKNLLFFKFEMLLVLHFSNRFSWVAWA
jgi:hypothetical protein